MQSPLIFVSSGFDGHYQTDWEPRAFEIGDGVERHTICSLSSAVSSGALNFRMETEK